MSKRIEKTIAVDLVDFHPSNRQSDAAEVKKIAASIQADGQLVRALVRPVGKRYQLVAGERRLRALQLLKRKTIDVEVRELSDLETLKLQATENVERGALTPIDVAQGIDRLVEAGAKLAEASKQYRVSTSQGSNLRVMLGLPVIWKKRIAAGDVAPTVGRELARLPKQLLPLVDEQYREGRWSFDSRDDYESAIAFVVNRSTRVLDPKVKRYRTGYPTYRDLGCQLKITKANQAEVNEKLAPFEFTGKVHGNKYDKSLVTLNVEAFDELHGPLMKAKAEKLETSLRKRRSGNQAAAGNAEAAAKQKAEQRKTSRKNADAQMVVDLIRSSLAWRYVEAGEPLERLLASALLSASSERGFHLAEYALRAAGYEADELDAIHVTRSLLYEGWATGPNGSDWRVELARSILWPPAVNSENHGSKKHGKTTEPLWTVPAIDVRPCVIAPTLFGYAADVECDLAAAWESARGSGAERKVFEDWLNGHTIDELRELAAELKVDADIKRSVAFDVTKGKYGVSEGLKKKRDIVAAFLICHSVQHDKLVLPIPKSLTARYKAALNDADRDVVEFRKRTAKRS